MFIAWMSSGRILTHCIESFWSPHQSHDHEYNSDIWCYVFNVVMLTVWQATDYCPMMEQTRRERLAGPGAGRQGRDAGHGTWLGVGADFRLNGEYFIQNYLITSLSKRCWLRISRQFSTFAQELHFYLPSDERVVKNLVHHEKQI